MLLTGPIGGTAQEVVVERTSVRGIVVADDTGEPVEHVAVRIVEFDLEVVTGADGRFEIGDIADGRYTVEIVSLGRVADRRRVDFSVVRDLVFRIPPPTLDAPAIEVVVDRFRVVGGESQLDAIPGSAHILGPAELGAQHLAFDDVHAMLRQVPGVNIQEEEGFGLRPNIGIRGTGSERSSKITLMEDGVLIAPAPYAAPAAYYFPVAGRMDAIEIRKGSSQIKYGPHTIGGALNLVSGRIPRSFGWSAEVEGGQDGTARGSVRVGDRSEHFGWLAETYQIRTDGFKRIDGGGDAGFDIGDVILKGVVHASANARVYQELGFKFGRYSQTSHETYLGLTDEDFRVTPYRRYAASREDVIDAEHTQFQVRHTIRSAAWLDVTTVAYRNDFHRNWYKLQSVLGEGLGAVLADPAGFNAAFDVLRGIDSADDALMVRANNRDYDARGVQTIAGLAGAFAGANHVVEVGVRYHEDKEDRFQHEDGFRMVGGRMEQTSAGLPGSQSNRVSTADAWSGFVQDEIRAGRWIVSPGIRFESIDFRRTDYAVDDPLRMAPARVRDTHVNGVIPGVGASVEAWHEIFIFGGVHRGFGPPGPGADEDTRPEESINYELGTRVRRGGLHAQATAFFSDYRNILGRATLATGDVDGSGALFNGGEVAVKGLELNAEYDTGAAFGTRLSIPLAAAYTFTRGVFETGFESDYEPWGVVESGDELPYLPRHQIQLSAGVAGDAWSARLFVNRASRMRTRAGQGAIPDAERTDAYTVLNLAGEVPVSEHVRFVIGVQNLTNEAHVVARRPAGARPGLPRTVSAGFSLVR